MSTFLPLDQDNNPIPALRLKNGGAHAISFTGISARNSTAFDEDTLVVTLYATQDVYVAFGGSSIAATTSDHFFPAGTYYDVAIGNAKGGHSTHIAALSTGTDGTLYVSERV